MAAYIAMRVEMGKMNYNRVFKYKLYQQFKEDCDAILAADGYEINEKGWAVKSKSDSAEGSESDASASVSTTVA